MLNQLTINNYAIVDELNLELKSGMSVITGETGAGKSIMLDALGLALGDRADKTVIRVGAKRANISACFAISTNHSAKHWLENNDLDTETNNECILRRVLTKDGRSKAYINDQPTSLNSLKELGEMLIDIHSQHEHQSLLKTTTHQRLLDEFCKHSNKVSKLADISKQWHLMERELIQIQSRSEQHNAHFQLISYQVKEFDELALEANELEQLEAEHSQLSNAEASLSAIHLALDICSDNEQTNIQQAIHQGISALQDIPNTNAHIENTSNLLNTALIQIEEASSELSQALEKFELNPARLEAVEQRMSDIHQLARKHKLNPKELVAYHQDLHSQLQGMDQSDVLIEELQTKLDSQQIIYHKLATTISTTRKQGAKKLEKAINKQLSKLDMSSANFYLAINTEKTTTPHSKGYENCEFLVSTNSGQEPNAISKVASGGELSRISLAIQVATAQTSSIPSLVFDEVDVGIGGGTAKVVGELLRELGEKGQILCVTHQPQVACQGHHHLFVSKKSSANTTTNQITELNLDERTAEIARMLGGDELSENSLAHAKEMMR